ncbi:MAG: hypothetical protein ACOY33_06130 [Pseudomonadota bacterium]
MIVRHPARVSRVSCLTAAACGLWLCGTASVFAAEDAPTADAPAATDPAAGTGNTPADTPFDPPFDPGFNPDFDPAFPELPAQPAPAAATTPDYKAPRTDFYVDVAYLSADVSRLGFDDRSGSQRIIVGLQLQDASRGRFHVAPEIGYLRMNPAERDLVSVDNNNPSFPQYVVTITDSFSAHIATLDFGARLFWDLPNRLTAFSRLGMGFHHLTRKRDRTLSYTPKNPVVTPPKASESLLADSVTDTDLAPFAAVGIALKLGKVPSIYLEQGARQIDGDNVNLSVIGFLLNF